MANLIQGDFRIASIARNPNGKMSGFWKRVGE